MNFELYEGTKTPFPGKMYFYALEPNRDRYCLDIEPSKTTQLIDDNSFIAPEHRFF